MLHSGWNLPLLPFTRLFACRSIQPWLPSPTSIPTLYYPSHKLPQPIANVTPWALTHAPYLRDDYIAAGHQYYPSTPDQHIVQQPSHTLAHPSVSTIPPKNPIYDSTRQSTLSSHESLLLLLSSRRAPR